jgi:aryl-alcohol dehydrogenase-like predicted oxidoreductase
VPGGFGPPAEAEAISLLQAAHDAGVNLFDTAPAYGTSEMLLGKAFAGRPDVFIATKVDVPPAGSPADGRAAVRSSIERSLRALKKDVIDIVQVHNATTEVLDEGWLIDALEEARAAELLRHIGVSVYGEAAAMEAIAKRVDVLQVALNVLDQRMLRRVVPSAQDAGTGVIVRSVYLKGVLTDKSQWLPPEMDAVRAAADRARQSLGATWESLAETALRFCLSLPGVHAVLVGVRTQHELRAALDTAAMGPLDPDELARANTVALDDGDLLDPRKWNLP